MNHGYEKVVIENALLKSQLDALTEQVQARKERKSGKRVIIKDGIVISVNEIVEKLVVHEEEMKEKGSNQRKEVDQGSRHRQIMKMRRMNP